MLIFNYIWVRSKFYLQYLFLNCNIDKALDKLERKLKDTQANYESTVADLQKNYEKKLQKIQLEKNEKIATLTDSLETSQNDVRICVDKIAKMSEYIKKSRELIKKLNWSSYCNASHGITTNYKTNHDDNLLHSLNNSEVDASQGLFKMDSVDNIRQSDNFQNKYLEAHQKITEDTTDLKKLYKGIVVIY